MAHLIQLPVEMKFEVEPAVWHVGTAIPAGWHFSMYGRDEPLLRVVEPVEFRGLENVVDQQLLSEDLRTRIDAVVNLESREEEGVNNWRNRERHILRRLKKRIAEEFANDQIEVLICDRPRHLLDNYKTAYRRVNPWTMRDEFLRTKSSVASLAEFLNKYGEFGDVTGPRADLDNQTEKIKWTPHIVLPDEIWKHKEAISVALRSGPAEWFKNRGFDQLYTHRGFDRLYARPEFPHFGHEDHLIVDSLYTSVTVDFLRGIKFHACARKDCGFLFKLESRHKRRYCGQYCAHLESVRRNRRQNRRRNRTPLSVQH
jgi:hypothetical protein